MQNSDSESMLVARWERQPAPQAVVLEGEILGQTPEGQIRLLQAVLEALVAATAASVEARRRLLAGLPADSLAGGEQYRLVEQAAALLGPSLPYTEQDLQRVLDLLVNGGVWGSVRVSLLTRFMRHIDRFAAANGLPSSLRPLLERERDKLHSTGANQYARLRLQLERLLEPDAAAMPEPSEPWAAAMLAGPAGLASLDAETRAAWRALLAHGARLDQTRPSARWLQAAGGLVERAGFAAYREHALAWLSAAAEPVERTLSEQNSAVLKGLVWTCSNYEDAELARALASLAEALLRWLPRGLDWRGLKAGNACLNALAAMPGPEPLTQLSRLALRLKGKQLQASVGRAMDTALERRRLPREDLEELAVPTHGVDPDGALRGEIGGVCFEIAITGAGELEWGWIADGARRQSAPASLRGEHAAELRRLRAMAKELQRTLSSQRAHVEQLLFSERSWSVEEWRVRYLRHPLLGRITRSLIWEVKDPVAVGVLGIPVGDGFVDADGRSLPDPAEGAEVRLWHPCRTAPELVAAWRRRVLQLGIAQPFKQAAREVYTLTAQEWAAAASARFAGRILRQQQFNALCRERGWQYTVRGPWQGGQPRAIRALPRWNVQAEFWLRLIEDSRAHLIGTAMYALISSDVLRFSRPGGGDCLLSEVPEHVISELLRDIDLFVSASELSTTRPSS